MHAIVVAAHDDRVQEVGVDLCVLSFAVYRLCVRMCVRTYTDMHGATGCTPSSASHMCACTCAHKYARMQAYTTSPPQGVVQAPAQPAVPGLRTGHRTERRAGQ